ncbi:MAG: hypothetical protein WA571_03350 [Candidatus Binatus sp.]
MLQAAIAARASDGLFVFETGIPNPTESTPGIASSFFKFRSRTCWTRMLAVQHGLSLAEPESHTDCAAAREPGTDDNARYQPKSASMAA